MRLRRDVPGDVKHGNVKIGSWASPPSPVEREAGPFSYSWDVSNGHGGRRRRGNTASVEKHWLAEDMPQQRFVGVRVVQLVDVDAFDTFAGH